MFGQTCVRFTAYIYFLTGNTAFVLVLNVFVPVNWGNPSDKCKYIAYVYFLTQTRAFVIYSHNVFFSLADNIASVLISFIY